MRFIASEQFTYSGTLNLYVHYPKGHKTATKKASAIVLVHGGGWFKGDATWMASEARRFTDMGLVAVTIDYRLSNQENITPLESIQDVKAAINWVRTHSTKIGVNPSRVAVYGASAGAHLAVMSHLFITATSPNAILVMSPDLSVAHSRWFRRITWKRIDPAKLSPIECLQSRMPPMIIVHGTEDTMANYKRSEEFMNRSVALGNYCELYKFNGYGHMLVAPGKDDRTESSDREATNIAFYQMYLFLKKLHYL
jgi:acetyl esterase/lipase